MPLSSRHSRPAGLVAIAVLAVVILALRSVLAAPPARASDTRLSVPRGSDYLALGDSISFGFRDPATVPSPDFAEPATFVGYPEDVASSLHLVLANLACPGETSGSLISTAVTSNGCEHAAPRRGPGGSGYRSRFPLHVPYAGSQLQAATLYLRTHPDTRLVSLMIGINDLMICRETTADHCAGTGQLAAVLRGVSANTTTILRTIRDDYRGPIVVVDYYSFDYRSLLDDVQLGALDAAIDAAASPFGVRIANAYDVFRTVSDLAGGAPCSAGLLDHLRSGGCGIHPSGEGQDLLAHAVEAALRA